MTLASRAPVWVILAGFLAGACADADPDVAPRSEEVSSGALTALLPIEGLSYLAGRTLEERPSFDRVAVTVARSTLTHAAGGTIVQGPAEGGILVDSFRLAPDEEGASLVATARLGEVDLVVPILRRPLLGAPSQCRLRLSTTGGQAAVRLLPTAALGRELQPADSADIELRDADAVLDDDCPEVVMEYAEVLRATLDDAVAAAVTEHLTAVAQATTAAGGPGVPWAGGVGALRAAVAPSRSGTALRVRPDGVVRVYDVGVDALLEDDGDPCSPPPTGGAPPIAPAPSPPPLAPQGDPYRLALAVDAAFLSRALSWMASAGFACRDGGPFEGLGADAFADLPGVATLVTGGRPLRARLRPSAGLSVALRPGEDEPLLLRAARVGLAVYGDVDGAPLALARLEADVEVVATVELDDLGDLRLAQVKVSLSNVVAAPTILPEGPEGLLAAAPALYRATLAQLFMRHPVSLAAWTDRPAAFVAAEASDSHLLVYLDLR